MTQIDRILIRAKKAAQRKAERLVLGFVEHDLCRDIWTAEGRLWNGKKGAGCRSIVTEHDSKEAALSALYALADEYPNTVEDVAIIFGEEDLEDSPHVTYKLKS